MKHPSISADIHRVIATRVDQFLSHLPGVRDGDVESVHEARVASRRLRELLPLVAGAPRASDAEWIVAEAARRLGNVRDLDVMIDTLNRKESTLPSAALAIAAAKRTLTHTVIAARRMLIKALEQLELSHVATFRQRAFHRTLDVRARLTWVAPAYVPMLVDRIGLRAHRLREAVDHSTGLYFPNRLHSTRIAAKKLRYVVEVAADLGVWNPPHLLGDLKKIQAALGALHDAEVLRGAVESLVDDVVPRHETSSLLSALSEDIARWHAEYLRRRERLGIIADTCTRFVSGRSLKRPPARTILHFVQRTASSLPGAVFRRSPLLTGAR